MNPLADTLYGVTIAVTVVLAFLLFKAYLQSKETPALYLGATMIVMLVNISPLLIAFSFSFPITTDQVELLTSLFAVSNVLGVLGLLLLNLFFDFTSPRRAIKMKTWLVTATIFFCISFLFYPGVYTLEVGGERPSEIVISSSYNGPLGTIAIIAFYFVLGIAVARLWNWARLLWRATRDPTSKRDALVFAGSLSTGLLSFSIFNVLKRAFPPAFGLDVLSFALCFVPAIILYIKRPGAYLVLGDVPDHMLVMTSGGLPVLGYNFASGAFIEAFRQDPGDQHGIVKGTLLHAALDAFSDALHRDGKNPATIQFEDQQVLTLMGDRLSLFVTGTRISRAFESLLRLLLVRLDQEAARGGWNVDIPSGKFKTALKRIVLETISLSS